MVKKLKKILIVTTLLLFITGAAAYTYMYYTFQSIKVKKSNSINKMSEEKRNKQNYNDRVKREKSKFKKIEGLSNILLIGTDERGDKEVSRADSIMIITIDGNNKEMKLTTIMRDTYVDIPGYDQEKINHSYAYGGSELLKDAISKNYGIDIENYVIINFEAFKEIIDVVDGIEVEIKDYEVSELNRCIYLEIDENLSLTQEEKNKRKKETKLIKNSGVQTLNGQQALSYARIRKVGNWSFERGERQRRIVTLLINKIKTTSVFKYASIAQNIIPYVKTNIDFNHALDLAYTVYSMGLDNINQLQIPVNKLSDGRIYSNKGWVLLNDIEENKEILNQFIFDNKKYNPNEHEEFIYSKSNYYIEENTYQQDIGSENIKNSEVIENHSMDRIKEIRYRNKIMKEEIITKYEKQHN